MPRYIELKPEGIHDASWEAIIEAWENGLSDKEAAFRASDLGFDVIKAKDIQAWCKDDPELAELRGNLLNALLSSAKLTIAETLKDPDSKERVKTARWYLERKGADEFSTKQAVAFEGAVVELSLEDKERKLKELMEQFHSGE